MVYIRTIAFRFVEAIERYAVIGGGGTKNKCWYYEYIFSRTFSLFFSLAAMYIGSLASASTADNAGNL